MAEHESQPADTGDPTIEQIASADAPDAVAEARPEDADVAAELAAEDSPPETSPPETSSLETSSLEDSPPETSSLEDSPPEDSPPETSSLDTSPPEAGAVEAVDHNDFLGELARAMHTAAESQYERINAEHERRRTDQVETIAARASSEVENLKTGSEGDIRAIEAWAKAEAEKIKNERLRRTDARREQLANQLERQETIKAREVFAVEVAIDAHRTEIDAFFGRMTLESDPAAIARVASTLPPFPSLAEIAEEARRGATAEFASLDDEAAPAPSVDNLNAESDISESRLMAVVGPTASLGGNGEAAPPWESEPYAVGVVLEARVGPELEPPARFGATLLRAIPSIRPMAGRQDPESSEDDAQR